MRSLGASLVSKPTKLDLLNVDYLLSILWCLICILNPCRYVQDLSRGISVDQSGGMRKRDLISWQFHSSFFAVVRLRFFALEAITNDDLPTLENATIDLFNCLFIVKFAGQGNESVTLAPFCRTV